MKRDLFRRYVWLIETVRHSEKITFEEISSLWRRSALNEERAPLALRTFHNHRDAVENLFGLKIICDRSDHHRYYVDDRMELDKLKIWMLQTLSMSDEISETNGIENRILVDMTPDEKFCLNAIIEAMKGNRMIIVTHLEMVNGKKKNVKVAPYCVRFNNHTWYLLAREPESGQMRVYDLNRVCGITILHESFLYEENFNPSLFFKNYYGMDINQYASPVSIRLRVKNKTRNEFRMSPIHPTQTEVEIDINDSVFEYNFVPGEFFKKAILAMGGDVEVLSPENLRNEIARRIANMAENYSI